MSYSVIFIGAKGPELLTTRDDKGACRRAWSTCARGAAIVSGETVLEFKSGTPKPTEAVLRRYAAELARNGGAAVEAPAPPPPPPPRPAPVVDEVEPEDDTEPVDDGVCLECNAVRPDHTRWCAQGALEDAPAPPPPPVVVHEPVKASLSIARAEVIVETDDEPATDAPKKCAAKGCTELATTPRENTPKGTECMCRRDRDRARARAAKWKVSIEVAARTIIEGVTERPEGAAPSKYKRREPSHPQTRPMAPQKAPRAPKPSQSPNDPLAIVRRFAAVVHGLGGIDTAERLALVVARVGGVGALESLVDEVLSLTRAA